jgi:hypothetical protein
MYEYIYEDNRGDPVTKCPECGRDWCREGGVTLEAYIAGFHHSVATTLDEKGHLVDVDNLVANGYHSATRCGHCEDALIDLDGVIEHQRSTQ